MQQNIPETPGKAQPISLVEARNGQRIKRVVDIRRKSVATLTEELLREVTAYRIIPANITYFTSLITFHTADLERIERGETAHLFDPLLWKINLDEDTRRAGL